MNFVHVQQNNLPSTSSVHFYFLTIQGPWDVVRQVFSSKDHKTMSFNEKMDLFFHDYSIAPLFVQENYLSVVPENARFVQIVLYHSSKLVVYKAMGTERAADRTIAQSCSFVPFYRSALHCVWVWICAKIVLCDLIVH